MSKPSAPRREADNEAKAVLRAVRISPRKLDLVAATIRGKKAATAVNELTFSKKRIRSSRSFSIDSAFSDRLNISIWPGAPVPLLLGRPVDINGAFRTHFFLPVLLVSFFAHVCSRMVIFCPLLYGLAHRTRPGFAIRCRPAGSPVPLASPLALQSDRRAAQPANQSGPFRFSLDAPIRAIPLVHAHRSILGKTAKTPAPMRAKPFSGKKKKEQLQQKRSRKAEQEHDDDFSAHLVGESIGAKEQHKKEGPK